MYCAMRRRIPALLCLVLLSLDVLAVPLGYRYVGSRVVSEGRHVYWYWNSDFFQVDATGTGFVARLYARNVEKNEERDYVAFIRCDSRTYRRMDSRDAYEPIDEGEPIYSVWRAGCDNGRAVSLAVRNDRLNGTPATTERADAALPAKVAPANPPSTRGPFTAPTSAANNAQAPPPAGVPRPDERRVDSCIRFAEHGVSQFGDAAITNTCNFAVEVVYCYKGGRGRAFDCPTPPRRTRADSLGPGATHNLPEYKRGSNSGIALVACKGAVGTVIPQLNTDGGKTGCG